jgi:hypothetical protein
MLARILRWFDEHRLNGLLGWTLVAVIIGLIVLIEKLRQLFENLV